MKTDKCCKSCGNTKPKYWVEEFGETTCLKCFSSYTALDKTYCLITKRKLEALLELQKLKMDNALRNMEMSILYSFWG